MNPPKLPTVSLYTSTLREVIHREALIYNMPTVAAGCCHILNIDFMLLQFCQGSDGTRAARAKTNTLLSYCKSAIPSAGKESGEESTDSAKQQSNGALNAVIKHRSEAAQRLKDENADLKRRLEELEEKHKSSPVCKSTISKCHFE